MVMGHAADYLGWTSKAQALRGHVAPRPVFENATFFFPLSTARTAPMPDHRYMVSYMTAAELAVTQK